MNLFGGKRQTVLVIGCGGTLGTRLIEQLEQSHNIIGVARTRPVHFQDKGNFIAGDIASDADQLYEKVVASDSEINSIVFSAVQYDLGELVAKDPQMFLNELQVGLVGPLSLANRFLQQSWIQVDQSQNRKRNRSVLFITSGSGLGIIPNAGQATYSTVKSAQHMLMKHMALEYGKHGIRVNAVAPGSLQGKTTMETTLREIEYCIADKNVEGQIRAVVGNDVTIF